MKPPALHFRRIDTLRGIAIAMVFFFHFLLAVHQRNPALAKTAAEAPGYLQPLLQFYVLGLLGVPLFFVISGFCIQCSFLSWRAKNGSRKAYDYLPHFFHRRFWRIIPPYLLALLVVYALKTPEPWSWVELKKLAAHALLINTLVPELFYNLNSSFWSICVEWQLYLIFPLYLALTLLLGARASLIISAATTLSFQLFLSGPNFPPYLANLPFRWWFDWSLGAYLAQAYTRKQRVFPGHFLAPVVLGAATYASLIWLQSAELKRILPPFFFAALLELAIWSKKPLNRTELALGHLGQCSYSFYLWHQPATYLIVGLVAPYFARTGPVTIWIGLCGAIFAVLWILSVYSFRWIEKPSIQLGELLTRRRSGRPATSGSVEPQLRAALPSAVDFPVDPLSKTTNSVSA